MKNLARILIVVSMIFASAAATFAQDCPMSGKVKASGSDDPQGTKVDGGMLYGKAIDPGASAVSYSDFLAAMNDWDGKDVVIKGTVSEVCQAMGCWMTMSVDGKTTRVKTAHEFFLPKDVAGREAIVAGKFKIAEISEEDARHYNDESPNPTVKSEDIVGPQKALEIEASGIVIMDPAGK